MKHLDSNALKVILTEVINFALYFLASESMALSKFVSYTSFAIGISVIITAAAFDLKADKA